MADMALEDNRPTDLRVSGRYTLRLGDTITAPEAARELYTSIRYNHKPANTILENATTSVSRGIKPHTASLTIRDGSNSWSYEGTDTRADKHTYVLLKTTNDTYTLERLDALQRYRLISAPDQPDMEQIKKQYPPLPLDDPITNDDTASESELDVHNPFDFRNHLDDGRSPKKVAANPVDTRVVPTAPPAAKPPTSTASPAKPVKANKADAATKVKPPIKAKTRDPNAPAPRRGRPPKSGPATASSGSKTKDASRASELAAKQPTLAVSMSTQPSEGKPVDNVPDAGDDDDDDLEAEMLKAMEEDDDAGAAGLGPTTTNLQPPPTIVEEEEEESEEE